MKYHLIWKNAVRLAVCALLLLMLGCRARDSQDPGVQVDLNLSPSPPVVGNAEVHLKLKEAGGIPLDGAEVRVEGNMNHAGMKPSFADLKEVKPGEYAGMLEFTMGGDWFLLVTAKTPDGRTVEQKIDISGVKSQ